MRKRVQRQHYPARANPMLQPASPAKARELLDLQLIERMALEALDACRATSADLAALRTSSRVALGLCLMGYGAEQVRTPHRALAALVLLERQGIQGQAVSVVREMLDLHDAQREIASAADYVRALAAARPG